MRTSPVMRSARTLGIGALLVLGACASDSPAVRRPTAAVAATEESQTVGLWKFSTEGASAPVLAWLRSVKNKDVKLLEGALSMRVKAKLGDVDWADLLAYYERLLEKALGPWTLEDFVFTGVVQREDRPGAANVQCKFVPGGRPAKDMRIDVVCEGAEWRIDVFPGSYKKPAQR